jgi:transposase
MNETISGTTVVEAVVGLDLSDRKVQVAIVEMGRGQCVEEGRLALSETALAQRFASAPKMRVVLEVGTHSPWVSRLLEAWGHEVLVANPRQVQLIAKSRRKTDRVDALTLARLGRLDPELLHPIRHRSEGAQTDLAQVRARAALVRTRTGLIQHVRGALKSLGYRLPSCSAEVFARRAASALPPVLAPALEPLVETIDALTGQIRLYDRSLEELARTKYPETDCLRQVDGVGGLTALTYVLTLEDAGRFSSSRTVGAYLGLTPRLEQSGSKNPQRGITKHGDPYLRALLVQCAQYILGPFGKPSDLRSLGQRIAERGGANAKKRAVIAVARKLAVLLHRLWRTGDTYQPLRTPEEIAA